MPKTDGFTSVEMDKIPDCDLCRQVGVFQAARYDARLRDGKTWGYVCEDHFQWQGCRLGLGFGQKLILKRKETKCQNPMV